MSVQTSHGQSRGSKGVGATASAWLSKKSRLFADANPWQVSEYVNHHIGRHRLRAPAQAARGATLWHRQVGSLNLCRLSYGTEARVSTEGLEDLYHVQLILHGACRYTVGGESVELRAGQALMLNPGEALDLTYSDECEKFIVKVPASLLKEVCAEHRWLRFHERPQFNLAPYHFEQLQCLLRLLQLVCEEAETASVTPQILQHYARVVTGKLMTMLQHDVDLSRPSAHSASFERIVDYIEDNIKRDITAEELAGFARLSLRSLYLLFEKSVKMTPLNFIRQKKLEYAYAALMNPANQFANVTAVALEYGFTHLGRFSECYKMAFGMLPSESLRRSTERIVTAESVD